MEKLVILANRYSGALSRMRGDTSLAHYARDAGFQPEVIYTRNGGHLRRVLRERVIGRLTRVAVAGGDGTLHSAVQVLAGTETTLGILPQGTANNFATALRLPRDLPSAFQVIAAGDEYRVDLGEVEGEYFTESTGVGIFADTLVLARAGRTKSVLRSLGAFVRLWLVNRPHRLTLTLDGQRLEAEALNVTVANSFMVSLNLPIAPCARVTDGELDVVVIEALTRAEMLPYFHAVRTQTHLDLPKVHSCRARKVEIRGRHRDVVHVDDQVRKRTPVTARVRPGILKVIVDRL